MGEGREGGGSDRGCWESVGPDEVGGLEEDLKAISTAMKWLERKDPEPRKDWRKEWFCS
jgi:hypothetical protein